MYISLPMIFVRQQGWILGNHGGGGMKIEHYQFAVLVIIALILLGVYIELQEINALVGMRRIFG
jgi:hypothetical protein